MDYFGKEYFTQTAYFLARGRTLDIIKKYEADKASAKQDLAQIAAEYGAVEIYPALEEACSKQTLDPDIFENREGNSYRIRRDTPAGQALLERIADIPDTDWHQHIFAKRLSGAKETKLNPDNIDEYGERHYELNKTDTAARFSRIGDEYVVQVPRVLRAVFDASAKHHPKDSPCGTMCESHRFEWFTPPDSEPIPYSKMTELREREMGDQTVQRTVQGQVFVPFNPRPRR